MKKTILSEAITLVNSGKSIPAIDLVRQNPNIAAALSKLVSPRDKTGTEVDERGNRTIHNPNNYGFGEISRDISNKNKDFKSMMELFPETELVAQILVSLIISPKDMTKGDVNFILPDNLKCTPISGPMMVLLKEYFTKDYNAKKLLPEVLRKVLIEQGSDPFIVIPENSIDELINGSAKVSTESIKELLDENGIMKSAGFFGNPSDDITLKPRTALESMSIKGPKSGPYNSHLRIKKKSGEYIDTNLHIIDNPNCVKLPRLLNKITTDNIKDKLRSLNPGMEMIYTGLGVESYDLRSTEKHLSDQQLSGLLYKNKHNTVVPFRKIKADSELPRLTVGAPLTMRLPPEAVFPLTTPGNPEEKIGFMVAFDSDGNPLTNIANSQYVSELGAQLNNKTNDMSSYLLTKSRDGILGREQNFLYEKQAVKLYADIVESDILARARNGIIGRNVSIARNTDVYRLMLARHFANQLTQLVFVPAELMTYFAYKYDDRGIGVSLSSGARYINNFRGYLLFAKVMSQVRNSIGVSKVVINIDEDDGDPWASAEMMMHEFMRTRQGSFPLEQSTPGEMADIIKKMGYEFTFKGNTALPDTEVEVSEVSRSYVLPDSDLEDELRKRNIMMYGLSPETVDNGWSGDLATSIVANNVLLSKRVSDMQQIFVPQFTDHFRKVAANDGNLITALKAIVHDKFGELMNTLQEDDELKKIQNNKELVIRLIVSEFISNFEAQLPQPDSSTLENQAAAFDIHTESLDKVLDSFISAELLNSEFGGQASSKADAVKGMFKALVNREWIAKNNFMPEVAELFTQMLDTAENNDSAIINTNSEYNNKLIRFVVKLLAATTPVAVAGDKDIEKITAAVDDSGGFGDSSTDTESSGDEFGGGDDGFGGGDDFGGMPDADGSDEDTNTQPDAPDEETEDKDKEEKLPPLDKVD